MKFVLQALFPIGLIFIPMLLVGRPATIAAVGFTMGLAMAALAILPAGAAKALSGGEKGARGYLWISLGIAALAAVVTLYVYANLDALAPRPAVQASVSMMPLVFWGGAGGFVLAAAFTWLKRRSA